MKRSYVYSGIAALLLAVPVAALARAEHDKGSDHGKGHRSKLIKRYDSDGDGTLSDSERQVARADHRAKKAARRAEMLAKYDANKDGTLDDGERNVMRQARIDEAFAKLDANKDGVLSRSEFAANRHGSRGPHHGR